MCRLDNKFRTSERCRQPPEVLSRPPLESSRSVVVIEQADTMTESAANALLKTLEEPGKATLITAAYGLGENVVQGAVNPDEYLVFKPTLKNGYKPILDKRLGSKAIKMIYDDGGSRLTKNIRVNKLEQDQFCISDQEILTLARWTTQIEEHYSQVRGTYTPMDIEWAKDGITGELFIVQARPETVQSQKAANILKSYEIKERSQVLAVGRSGYY